MADKDEVQPDEESGAAESTPRDADGPHGSHAIVPGAPGTVDAETGEVDLRPEAHMYEAPVDLTEEEFAEIVRNSGVGDPVGDADGLDVDDRDGDGFEGDEVAHEHVTDADSDSDADPDSDNAKVLEPAGVGATTAGGLAGPKRPAKSAKDAPTGKRDQVAKPERTTPVKFVKQSVGELRKVVYPTGQQLANYFVVVLVFVLFIIAYVSLLDLGLGALIFKIFS